MCSQPLMTRRAAVARVVAAVPALAAAQAPCAARALAAHQATVRALDLDRQ